LNKRNRELLSRDPVFYPEQPIVTTENEHFWASSFVAGKRWPRSV